MPSCSFTSEIVLSEFTQSTGLFVIAKGLSVYLTLNACDMSSISLVVANFDFFLTYRIRALDDSKIAGHNDRL